MIKLNNMPLSELEKLETRVRRAIAKERRKLAKREILAVAERHGMTVEEVFGVPDRRRNPVGKSNAGKPHKRRVKKTRQDKALGVESRSQTGIADGGAARDVLAKHRKMIADLPTKTRKIQALVSEGYSNKAIARAVETRLDYVYQVKQLPNPYLRPKKSR